ncbi:hypothetical protein [Mycobacterium sp.]|jgi:hypothetical protein|uniref:hypothetical protein n=1 Tax=Mycobacterium sp. TaxID=1785 RepID=UPI003F9ADFF8
MRYNPPPNWPKPPKGWVPHADWSPDPSWPPPPPGWRLWVEEDAPDAQPKKSALGRLGQTGDDVEYFGDDRAWSEDSGPAPAHDEPDAAAPAPPPQPTEVAPEDLAVHHLGRHATIKWDDDHTYVIGKIFAVSADAAAVNLKIAGIEAPVSFPRAEAPGNPGNPRLYVWI